MFCTVRWAEGTERRWNVRQKREKKGKKRRLERSHVIEGMVQLLTNGLVLQLLSIQFIWRSEADRQVWRTAATQTSQKAGREGGERAEGGRGKTKRNEVRPF